MTKTQFPDILRVEEEVQSNLLLASVPPRRHGRLDVRNNEILWRRLRALHTFPQLFRAHLHVLVLPPQRVPEGQQTLGCHKEIHYSTTTGINNTIKLVRTVSLLCSSRTNAHAQ